MAQLPMSCSASTPNIVPSITLSPYLKSHPDRFGLDVVDTVLLVVTSGLCEVDVTTILELAGVVNTVVVLTDVLTILELVAVLVADQQ